MRSLLQKVDNLIAKIHAEPARQEPKLLVLALHTVLTNRRQLDAATLLPQQRLTLSDLRETIESLHTLHYRFVSPVQVNEGLLASQKYCMLTFDDGYRNNLDALPLLKEYGVPAVFFVVPERIEDGRSFWWDAVYRKARSCACTERQIWQFMEKIKRLKPSGIAGALRQAGLIEADFFPIDDLDRPLNRSELMALSTTPGMFIGNHTWNHDILSRCDHGTGVESLRRAQDYLRLLGGNIVEWVAYPNGDWNEAVLAMVRSAGLRVGLTLEPSAASKAILSDPLASLALGRFLLRGDTNIALQCARMDMKFSLEQAAVRILRYVRRSRFTA